MYGIAGAPFVYPSAGNPRVAVLVPGFRETRQVRYFPDIQCEEARPFDPEVVAGTIAQLRKLALEPVPVTVRNAIVLFTYEGEAGLTEADRDLLWDVFGVPAFEQYLTERNRLIASECDAHEGLHINGTYARREGWQVDSSLCLCGDPRPRLLRVPEFAAPELNLCAEHP